MNPPALTQSLAARLGHGPPLLLDGATGTELERRGQRCDLPLWSSHALLAHPDVVEEIHAEYARAGAEIITANSFRTQRRTLQRGEPEYPGLADRDEELTTLAVTLARSGAKRGGSSRWVAGSAPPLEDCYRPDLVPSDDALQAEHARHAGNLARAGADLILIESMNSIREAVAACEAARRTELPFWVSFITGGSGLLLSHEPLSEAIAAIRDYSPLGVGINCVPPSAVKEDLGCLRQSGLAFGLHANLGEPGAGPWEARKEDCTPEDFAQRATAWERLGATWIGGCCGTTPAHTAALARALGSH
ncbi:MAG: homocysteine S-methyltransferase family protein [Myxococcota bacterium]